MKHEKSRIATWQLNNFFNHVAKNDMKDKKNEPRERKHPHVPRPV